MTPKMRGALEALKKMKHHADFEADKLTKRIEGETMPALAEGFKTAHVNVDSMHSIVDDINDFAKELQNSNGGDPLDGFEQPSSAPPRSSEVANK